MKVFIIFLCVFNENHIDVPHYENNNRERIQKVKENTKKKSAVNE